MKPRITVLTLAFADLERPVAFYWDGLGFPTEGIVGTEFEHGAVAFFDLESGLKLALWRRSYLAHDAGLTLTEASSLNTFCRIGGDRDPTLGVSVAPPNLPAGTRRCHRPSYGRVPRKARARARRGRRVGV